MGDEDDEEMKGLTDTEKALLVARRKQRAADEEFFREYEVQRAEEMAAMAAELEELLQQREERRQERQADLEQITEMLQRAQERRRAEEEELKQKKEAEKHAKAEARKKRLESTGGAAKLSVSGEGKPNFVLPKKNTEGEGEVGDGVKPPPAPESMGKEDVMAAKAEFMQQFQVELELDDLDEEQLKGKIKALHARIVSLETKKYDMEEKQKKQDYGLRELKERHKQRLKAKATKMGLDPEEYANAKHPFKIQVSSASDRQIDRRPYGERRDLYQFGDIPKKEKEVLHGSGRPPVDWGRTYNAEEIKVLRKEMEDNPPFAKYQETAPIEGAKPPVPVVKMGPIPVDEPDPVPKTEEKKDAAPAADAAPAPPAEEKPAEE